MSWGDTVVQPKDQRLLLLFIFCFFQHCLTLPLKWDAIPSSPLSPVLQSIWFVLFIYFLLPCATTAWSSVSSWISDFNSQLFFHHCLSPTSSWRGVDSPYFLLPTGNTWKSTPRRFYVECVPNRRSIIRCRTSMNMFIEIRCGLRDSDCSFLWMHHPSLQEIARLLLGDREAQLGKGGVFYLGICLPFLGISLLAEKKALDPQSFAT